MTSRLTQKRRIDDLYRTSCAAGLTANDMVQLLQVKRNTVLKRARGLGLIFRGSVHRRTDYPIATDYLSCHSNGLTTRETADRLGVCLQTVREWAHNLDVRFTRSSRRRGSGYTCGPLSCPHFQQCKARIASRQPVLCEQDTNILDQPENLLWSRNGGDEAIDAYYGG